jgi:hypothetical protein
VRKEARVKKFHAKRGRRIYYPEICPIHGCLMVVQQTSRGLNYLICPVRCCKERAKKRKPFRRRRKK